MLTLKENMQDINTKSEYTASNFRIYADVCICDNSL